MIHTVTIFASSDWEIKNKPLVYNSVHNDIELCTENFIVSNGSAPETTTAKAFQWDSAAPAS